MNNLKSQKFLKLFNEMLSGQIQTESQLTSSLLASNGQGDLVDSLNAQKEQTLSMRLDERNLLFLKKVREAKEKILNGTFGECEECAAEISEKRLMARPTACLCINCQEEKEREDFGNFNKRRDLGNGRFNEADADSHIAEIKTISSVKDIQFESVVDF